MEKIVSYDNGNVHIDLYNDGTLIRTFDETKPIIVDHPSSMDVKITNYCEPTENNPICAYCHEKSNTKGVHGDINKLLDVISALPAGVELACLSGNSIVYGENGAIEIKDLKVGDFIYDSNHNLKKITSIKKSDKQPFKLKGSKSFEIISSEDHPFIINGKSVEAQYLLNKKIDILNEYTSYKKDSIKIDLGEFITKPCPNNRGGSRGGKITENKVRLNHSSGWCDRFVDVNSDLMWLYGLVVAEGSKKGISLNINEEDFANKAIEIYKNIFNKESFIYKNKNSMSVEFGSSSIYETLFFKAMNVGKGARNKNISFLFKLNDKELIRSALYGMFQGDGAFRKRPSGKNKNYKSFNLTFKTTSKKLVFELQYLLRKHFGICASLYHGISPDRFIEGRPLKSSDYYKLDIYSKEDINKLFPWIFENDIDFQKLGNYKYSSNNTPYNEIIINKIEKSEKETLYDISLEESSTHIFPVNGYVLTHNCGGGNPLSHPDLLYLLKTLKTCGYISNITINQKHIDKYQDLINKIITKELVHGIGISYSSVDYLSDIKPLLKISDNVVFHVIMGVNTVEDIETLYKFCQENNKECKVLVLGYKHYGMGINYYLKNKTVEDNKYQWYIRLASYFKKNGLTLSFDNLAIEQLKLKRYFTEDAWNTFFMGSDGKYTMYIDGVNQEYAKSSTSPDRVSFNNMGLIEFFKTLDRNIIN